jgi:hypothetical protein
MAYLERMSRFENEHNTMHLIRYFDQHRKHTRTHGILERTLAIANVREIAEVARLTQIY